MGDSLKLTKDEGDRHSNNLPSQNGYWKSWFSWVLAYTFGYVIGQHLVFFLISIIAYLAQVPLSPKHIGYIFFCGAMGGALLGYCQWQVLRSRIQKAGFWIVVTAISWALSIPLMFQQLFAETSIITTIILSGFGPAIMGAIVGLFQWFVIRRQSKWTGLWILASIIGYICGYLISIFLVENTGLSSAIILIISGLIISMMTGIGFIFLFDKSPQNIKHAGILAMVSLFYVLLIYLPISLMGNHQLLKIEQYPVTSLAFSPDGKVLAAVSMEGEVKLWDVESGLEINSIKAPSSFSACIAYSPNGRSIAIVTDAVRLWDLDSGQLGKPFTGVPWDDDCTGFSPDGNLLATMELHRVILWDFENHEIVKEFHGNESGNVLQGLDFSPEGDFLTGNQSATLYIWNIETGQKDTSVIRGTDGYIGSIDISPDGKTVVVGLRSGLLRSTDSNENPIRLIDISTGIEKQGFGTRADVEIVRFSPDGTKLAVAYFQHPEVELFDVMTGQLVLTIKGHRGYVDSIAFSPDGNLLASAAWDGTIRIWDVSDIYNTSQ